MKNLSDEELLSELKFRFDEIRIALDEQQRLNAEILEVNKKLMDSESLKSHFLSNISNEIINPFTAIVGLARSILNQDVQDKDTVNKMTSMIYCEAFHLDFQLKNVFMAAAIEAGEVSPEFIHTNIQEIIGDRIDSYTIELKKKNLQIEFSFTGQDPMIFITDPGKFELIFTNLLNNAILFSEPGKKIIIQTNLTENELVMEVRDQGIGLDKDEIEIIFDRFRRLENKINSINRGNGLGLSITKALVDLLNGDIEIESVKNSGSVFRIILPKRAEAIPENRSSSAAGNETLFEGNMIY
jgi:signal transduction histidine kinase